MCLRAGRRWRPLRADSRQTPFPVAVGVSCTRPPHYGGHPATPAAFGDPAPAPMGAIGSAAPPPLLPSCQWITWQEVATPCNASKHNTTKKKTLWPQRGIAHQNHDYIDSLWRKKKKSKGTSFFTYKRNNINHNKAGSTCGSKLRLFCFWFFFFFLSAHMSTLF